jgi:CheY-like chemotaxis protein
LTHSILIADDSEDIRAALRVLIESVGGWTICGEATNGRDAIEKAQSLNPDLMVLDLSMPEIDGIAAAKILKTLLPALPIIMFTHFADDKFLQKEVQSTGVTQVVAKSDSQGLVHAIQQALAA